MQNNIIEYVRSLKAKGVSTNDIAVEFGVNPSTVRRWINGEMVPKIERVTTTTTTTAFVDTDEEPEPLDDTYLGGVTPYIKPKLNKEEEIEDIKEFIASLAPIQYPAPIRPSVIQTPNKIAMVIGDLHFGMEDQNVLDLFLKAVDEIKPEQIILNGDVLDLFAVSKYPKDFRYTQTLTQERNGYHKFLKILHDITVSYNTQIWETNANHSGDGSDSRWNRYLSNQIREIADLDIIRETLSYKNVFLPHESWSRIQLVDYVELVPGFVIAHGDLVRKKGGMSAVGLLEKWFCSILVNHTHRMGSSFQRLPSIGSQEEKIIRAYENGCACKTTECQYASAVNWQQGFSILNYSNKNNVAIEQVLVEDKSCAIITLGKTLTVRN